MKIFIDPGHNFSGADSGAVGNELREQDVTFGIAEKLKNLFVRCGDDVRMSRNALGDRLGSTVSESIAERCRLANEWGADLFLSIHCNAGGGTGVESLVYSLSGIASEYAARITEEISATLGLKNRGVKARPNLGVLRGTKAPAVLIETAFIDNAQDARLLASEQDKFAEAIFKGVTGAESEHIIELTSPNDIVWEYHYRGIVTDSEGMRREMEANPNGRLYWLARKTLQYMRERGI